VQASTQISVAVVASALLDVLQRTSQGKSQSSRSRSSSTSPTGNADSQHGSSAPEDDKSGDKNTNVNMIKDDDVVMKDKDDSDDDLVAPGPALYQMAARTSGLLLLLLKKKKSSDDSDNKNEQQYVQFLETVLTNMVQQCRQQVQSWQDFEFVWNTVLIQDNSTIISSGSGADAAADAVEQDASIPKYFHNAVIRQTALLLEPSIPGLPDTTADATDDAVMTTPATTGTGTTTIADDDKCKDDNDPLSPADRVQVVAWKLSCLSFNIINIADANSSSKNHRRQRLLASCAALGLLAVLPLIRTTDDNLTRIVTADPSAALVVDDDKDDEPATKRARLDPDETEKSETDMDITTTATTTSNKKKKMQDVLQVLLDAANQEAAFTRWACLEENNHKIAFDLTAQELAAAIQALAIALTAPLDDELKKENPALTRYPGADEKEAAMDVDGKDTDTDDSNLSLFLQALKKQVGDAKQLTWHLPSLVDSLNSCILQDLRRTPQPVTAIPTIDSISLASLQGSMDQFCAQTSQAPTKGQTDLAVAGVAGTRSAKAPATAEKMVESTIKSADKPTPTKNKQGPQSPGQTLRRAVTPTIITEGMELNEWTVSVLYLDVVKPSRNLKTFLEASSEEGEQAWHEVMMPVLNRTLLRLSQENMADKPTRIAPVSVGMEPEGQVNIFGDMTPDKQLCKAVVALYYHALEAVLYCESARLGVSSHPRIVLNDVFHRALLACCCSVVVKAVGATQKVRTSVNLQTLQIYSILHITESNPYDCLKVSESFHRALTLETARGKLGSPLIFALPRILQREAKQTEVQILDSLLWARDPKFVDSMPDKIEEFEEKSDKEKESDAVCLWPPEILAPTLREEIEDLGDEVARTDFPTPEHPDFAEYKCVSYLLRKLLRFAFHRIQALCKVLDVPHDLPVATQVWVAFRYLLRHNIDLLYDRHVDHWILCSLYGVGKTLKLKPDISFARIIEAYVSVRGQELGDVTCQRIVRHIKISTGSNANATIGNVILLYNKVFVPSMKDHLLKSRSLKRSILEVVEAQSLPSKTIASRSGTPSARSSDDGTSSGSGKGTLPRVGKPESKPVAQASKIVSKSEETVVESAP
jgi:hypothetical protein